MASTGEIGYGLVLAYSSDGVTYTPVSQVVDVKGPGVKIGEADISNNGSTSAYMEFIPKMADAGQLTFNCVYTNAILTALFGLVRATKYWKVTYADTHVWVCQGFITDLEPGAPLNDKQTIDITVKLTGVPTFA